MVHFSLERGTKARPMTIMVGYYFPILSNGLVRLIRVIELVGSGNFMAV